MHDNSQRMYLRYALPDVRAGDSVLEIGPARGNTIIRDSVINKGASYSYADRRNIDNGPGGVVVMPDDYSIAANDGAYDVVIAANVVEHVRIPWRWVPELARVARRSVILICPVSYKYHPGKSPDCWRIYSDGMKALLEAAGLGMEMVRTESLDGIHTDTIGIGTKS